MGIKVAQPIFSLSLQVDVGLLRLLLQRKKKRGGRARVMGAANTKTRE
jgi:hypothetical protein